MKIEALEWLQVGRWFYLLVHTEEGITGHAYLFAYTPLAQAPQHRGHPTPRPGGARSGPEAVTRLVPKKEHAAFPLGLLFKTTQSRLGQTAITSSSRSLARVAGRCTLKP